MPIIRFHFATALDEPMRRLWERCWPAVEPGTLLGSSGIVLAASVDGECRAAACLLPGETSPLVDWWAGEFGAVGYLSPWLACHGTRGPNLKQLLVIRCLLAAGDLGYASLATEVIRGHKHAQLLADLGFASVGNASGELARWVGDKCLPMLGLVAWTDPTGSERPHWESHWGHGLRRLAKLGYEVQRGG
jgi:hypothetical protein